MSSTHEETNPNSIKIVHNVLYSVAHYLPAVRNNCINDLNN